MTIKDILVATNYQKVLFLLVENSSKSFTEKEIVELTSVSKSGVNSALKELETNKVANREKRGRMSFWSVDDSVPLVHELKKTLNLTSLFPLVQELNKISQRIVLYGSAALGADTAESDIDLFILTDQKDKTQKTIQSFKTEREIKPVIQTSLEYATSKNKDKGFYDEVAKGITLFNREIDEQRL
jgi:predicted nucleotidyltransferase